MSTVFDRKAAAWVRRQYPGHEPVVGTVTFATDVNSYGGELDARIDVSWTEVVAMPKHSSLRTMVRTIESKAYDCDLNPLIAAIVDMEDPGDAE